MIDESIALISLLAPVIYTIESIYYCEQNNNAGAIYWLLCYLLRSRFGALKKINVLQFFIMF
jgi:hypothetical protein